MRMLILASAASLALASCSTTDPVTGEPSPIENVQSATAAACRFLPAAETVAEILASGDTRLTTASAVARAICAVVADQAPAGVATLFSAPPTVNGVVIRGERLPGGGGT
ncbi:hypothetical protein [Aliihoeflea sp. 40Bstr573]|uniref:hypothetical protein n=1 Tax=Aliihoeflea sp. 40Bstr573 TaxID=2696467 RepID=UPI0020955BE2|nr:hypothetical protein [Aliihoeflea sp. 40Bstr573]MCO6386339.1 hypothetical protein [Aliihoeflea sp. 40Bstr573]